MFQPAKIKLITSAKYIIASILLALFLIPSAFCNQNSSNKNSSQNILGDVKTIKVENQQAVIFTQKQQKVAIEFITPQTVRIQASNNDTFIPVANKKAPIVPDHKVQNIALKQQDMGQYHLLASDKVTLRIYKSPLRFEAYHNDNRTLYFKELKPLTIDENLTTQILNKKANSGFYGGGQQNGQFEFNNQLMEISYSGGWEEGDRPSPAPFYMSSAGYGVLRNTWSNGEYDFRSEGYLSASHQEQRFDAFYFFGNNIKDVLGHYTKLSGPAPLLPRWAFEYGDADCYNDADNSKKPGTVPPTWRDGPTGTTPDVVSSVAAKYREHDMPGGWILPNDGYGCGYTDLPEVVEQLASHGFQTGLWTEDGVDKIAWEVGTAGSRAQKLDVAWTGQGYQFALDANHDAATGIINNSDSRPFIWTVMGWAGIQRYAVTWTGDQSGSWDYIRWHIPTLIGSGLSGQVYATGDVDGIFGGSPETFTRDLQFKSFTPVLMGMSGWSKTSRKHPWWFEEPYRSINRKYLKLKMRLTPYMYTLAREAELTGAPIVRGLQWDYPQDANAYTSNHPNQFFLGKDFLVAPVYKSQTNSKGWREDIYLPQGTWIDYWDGTVTDSPEQGTRLDYPVTLEKMPIFVRAGAIIPMYPSALYDGQVEKHTVTFDLYPHGESSYQLYEDDGNTRQYQTGQYSTQNIAMKAPSYQQNLPGDIHINLNGVKGEYQGQLLKRAYLLKVHTRVNPDKVIINGKSLDNKRKLGFENSKTNSWYYDDKQEYGTLYIKLAKNDIRKDQQVVIKIDAYQQLNLTKGYPQKPDFGTALAMDSLKVISRPLEEPGYTFELAIDNDDSTWFRTSRDQALNLGANEFTLYLPERTAIAGFDIRGRTDKWWQYGQVKDYEIYVSDIYGDWSKPIRTGTLAHQEHKQQVRFEPIVGRMLRFRILSTHEVTSDEDQQNDKTQDQHASAQPYNALEPVKIDSISISEFTLHGPKPAKKVTHKHYLSANNKATITMNGLAFNQGLQVKGEHTINYQLTGKWQLFRADIGIDDKCDNPNGSYFQIFGDGKLLFDSAKIQKPAVIKPELDIRTIKHLSLTTKAIGNSACGNWANAQIIGFAGDKVKLL